MNNRMLRPILIGLVANVLMVSLCSAASFYVRKGATGANNGSDWTNAWSEMNKVNYSVVNPGDTIYVAAGTYGSFAVGKSGTAGNPITIKRATTSLHGTETGWNNAYDGLVVIDGNSDTAWSKIIDVSKKSYITIDGATKYGIRVIDGGYGIGADGANNLTVRYVELGGSAAAEKLGEDGIQGRGNNLLVEYSYLHDNDDINTHGDGIQWFSGTNITIRYNVMKNNGQIFMLTETAWGNEYINDLWVYYNVFFNRGGAHYQGISKKLCPQAGYAWYIYNNTFDLARPASGWEDEVFGGAGSCSSMYFKNNAIVNSRTYSIGGVSHSYNAYDNVAPYDNLNGIPTETGRVLAADLGFVNISSADYHLTSSSPLIGKGTNVGLKQDFDGKPVPATPSIGAFEPGSGSLPLTAPANLRVTTP